MHPHVEKVVFGIQTVSADLARRADALELWNDVANRVVAPVKVSPLARNFRGAISFAHLQGCDVICLRSSAARIQMQPSSRVPTLNLQVQVAGYSTNLSSAGGWRIGPGESVLFDPNSATLLELSSGNKALVVRLPVHTIEEASPGLRKWTGVPLRGRSGPGVLLSSFVREAWDQLQRDSGDWMGRLPAALIALMDMAYCPMEGSVTRPARTRIQDAVLRLIEQELRDPAFGVKELAKGVGVSTRHVQALMADMATTPTDFIRQRRLTLAAERLASEGTACSITDLAYDVGFNDLSTFCRAFRCAYGVTASEYRAGQRRSRQTGPAESGGARSDSLA